MLKIKNIGRIVGMSAEGREIIEAGNYTDSLRKQPDTYFVFRTDQIGNGKDWNRSHSIVLGKEPAINGMYYMFNMGLEQVTGVYIERKHLDNPVSVCETIRKVLNKTKHYYLTN